MRQCTVLTSLKIRDFAIIEALELEFRPGLTALTGETGAGKSIIVEALQLLCGGRAGAEVIRHGAERAELAATFSLEDAPGELRRWLEEQAIEAGTELVIRRVVTADGRSRAFVNGHSVPVLQLREVGGLLIDIHGQHEFQSLMRPAAQRELLDAYGRHEPLAGEVGIAHRVWLALLNRTLDLEKQAHDRDGRLSLLEHQLRELEALGLGDAEYAGLCEERTRLANHGRLAQAAQLALNQLYEAEDASAHAAASRALAALRGASAADPKLAEVSPLVESASIQIREAARELQHYLESLEIDTARQDQVERRLAAIEDLARKHRVTPAQLPERARQLASERASLGTAESDLVRLRGDLAAARARYQDLARQLSARRTTAALGLAKDITARMQGLGMAGGRFQVDVTPLESSEPSQYGADQIEFRVAANPGQPPRSIAKVASGGELSRLSLAVQVSCAAHTAPCMVFDEVDAGIGGAVAEIVGRELRALGESSQVLCVTHLPQVASQSHQQWRVSKQTDGRTTRTSTTELGSDERVEEIARMLGGIEVTAKAREHAREMLAGAAARSAEPPGTGGNSQLAAAVGEPAPDVKPASSGKRSPGVRNARRE
jgi:DNA repair protein RecN (Recombination protein N)